MEQKVWLKSVLQTVSITFVLTSSWSGRVVNVTLWRNCVSCKFAKETTREHFFSFPLFTQVHVVLKSAYMAGILGIWETQPGFMWYYARMRGGGGIQSLRWVSGLEYTVNFTRQLDASWCQSSTWCSDYQLLVVCGRKRRLLIGWLSSFFFKKNLFDLPIYYIGITYWPQSIMHCFQLQKLGMILFCLLPLN